MNLPFLLPWLKIIVAAVVKPCRNGRQPSRRLWDKGEAIAVVDAAAVEPQICRREGERIHEGECSGKQNDSVKSKGKGWR